MLTNLSALPSYENCSRGPFLGNEIFVHVCWYKNEVIVDIRRFNLDKPDILGIGLKKDNWYKLEDRTKNITKLVRDIDFNHTIFGSYWLRLIGIANKISSVLSFFHQPLPLAALSAYVPFFCP